jgi:hypothetical protein
MHQFGEVLGAGMLLGAAAGFRWAIGRWDKVRKMWRADWVRVKEAAERDVEVTVVSFFLGASLLTFYCGYKTALDQVLEKQVLIVPVRAAEGIEGIITKRKEEIGQLTQEVDKLTNAESRNS